MNLLFYINIFNSDAARVEGAGNDDLFRCFRAVARDRIVAGFTEGQDFFI
jgi:hypothetical protein